MTKNNQNGNGINSSDSKVVDGGTVIFAATSQSVEQKYPSPKELTKKVKPQKPVSTDLLDINRLWTVRAAYNPITEFIADNGYDYRSKDMVKFRSAAEEFLKYETQYITIRDSLDSIVESLENSNEHFADFPQIKEPNETIEVPKSIYNILVRDIREGIARINNSISECAESEPEKFFSTNCTDINQMVLELNSTKNLTDVVLLTRNIHKKLSDLNEQYTLFRRNCESYLTGEEYVDMTKKLIDATRGIKKADYNMYTVSYPFGISNVVDSEAINNVPVKKSKLQKVKEFLNFTK